MGGIVPAQLEVERDRGQQRGAHRRRAVRGNGVGQAIGAGQLQHFDPPHAALWTPGAPMQHGPQDLVAEEGEHADRLEQLAPRPLGRGVVQPGPGALLEPVGRGRRPGDRGRIQPRLHLPRVAREQYPGALHAPVEVVGRGELQVHVQQRRSVQADQQAGFPDVLPGKRRQQFAQAPGEGEPRCHHPVVRRVVDHDDEIQVRVPVEAAMHVGSAGQQCEHPRVAFDRGTDPLEEVPVRLRQRVRHRASPG